MENLKLQYLVVMIMLTMTAFAVCSLQHNSSISRITMHIDLQSIPMQIGKWQGFDLPINESVYEILETRFIINRTYIDEHGYRVYLSIVLYPDTKVDFHTPEACLGGRGERTSKKVKSLDIYYNNQLFPLQVAEIVASNPTNQSLSYYFYKTGNFIGQSYIKMRFSIAKNSLFNGDKRGSLIRISSTIFDNVDDTEQQLENFLTLLLPYLFADDSRK